MKLNEAKNRYFSLSFKTLSKLTKIKKNVFIYNLLLIDLVIIDFLMYLKYVVLNKFLLQPKNCLQKPGFTIYKKGSPICNWKCSAMYLRYAFFSNKMSFPYENLSNVKCNVKVFSSIANKIFWNHSIILHPIEIVIVFYFPSSYTLC